MILKLQRLLTKIQWFPPFVTRIIIGLVFLESGWGKLHDLEKVAGYFTDLGIPFPEIQAHLVAGTEFITGAMLLLGILTRLASLPLMVIMAVATFTARLSEITSLTDVFGFSEFLYILLLGWLVVSGPGPFSVDHFIKKKLE